MTTHIDPEETNDPEETIVSGSADDRAFTMSSESLGQSIGPYLLVKILGEGGMGTVYLAEQIEPIKRHVALKVIKLGMDTKEVVARFESERQALARMNHPNIAKVHDAGATDQGRPFFVMEYVEGIPLTDYCDQHQLDTKDRLALFMDVCQAVHHAHQKGIIHRDLKPQNVLVELSDGKPVAKVIDFGVARATDRSLSDNTLFTQHGCIIGTPAYMSPEQAEMSNLDIDTTTDVYSLGVMLYELLSGIMPLDPEELKAAGWLGIKNMIRDHEPKHLGTQLHAMGEEGATLAAKRSTTVARLARQCRNELDWITLRAMEKDRTRRYQSASEFAADIKRYLTNEPVQAHRPSMSYQLKKLVIRHKLRFALASIFVVLLAGFAITTTIQSSRIALERDRANQEAETAKQVSEFMIGLFEVSDPSQARGNTVTAREILDKGSQRISEELSGQPQIKARMMGIIGEVYMGLGLYDEADKMIKEALNIALTSPNKSKFDEANLLTIRGDLAFALSNYDQSLEYFRQALKIMENSPEADPLDLAAALQYVGIGLLGSGKHEQSREYLERSLAIREKYPQRGHSEMSSTLLGLGIVLIDLGDLEGSSIYFERALKLAENNLAPNHPRTARILSLSARSLKESKDFEGSKMRLTRALDIQEEVLGADHPLLAQTRTLLAQTLCNLNEFPEARVQLEKALAVQERVLEPNHDSLGWTLRTLAYVATELGDSLRGKQLLQRWQDAGKSEH